MSDIRLINCLFTDNKADFRAGAVFGDVTGTPSKFEVNFINCTLSRNEAGSAGGGGVFLNSELYKDESLELYFVGKCYWVLGK
jgi:hypothetical protein